MRAFVITMIGEPRSVEVARRCVASAKEFGVEVKYSVAITPRDSPLDMMMGRDFSTLGFQNNPYSRLEPCVSAFLSHSGLWRDCAMEREPYLILEHDAVFKRRLPDLKTAVGLCNLGYPSFGKFASAPLGFRPLTSKPHLPGAHGYYLTPDGARALLDAAKDHACPTDVFLSSERFPWITEYRPWPIYAEDTFTTIQAPLGCAAKHRQVAIL